MVAIAVEELADGPWVGVTLTGLSAGTDILTVWRTAGGVRQAVRGARDLEAIDSAFLIDYEVPLGRLVSYEVEVTAGPDAGDIDGFGDLLADGFVEHDETLVLVVDLVEHPLDPLGNLRLGELSDLS